MTATIEQAILALDACCDGASTRDAVGFNGSDASKGKRAAAWIRAGKRINRDWAGELYDLLAKYAKQLQTLGIDYAEIRDPRPQAAPQLDAERAPWYVPMVPLRETRVADRQDLDEVPVVRQMLPIGAGSEPSVQEQIDALMIEYARLWPAGAERPVDRALVELECERLMQVIAAQLPGFEPRPQQIAAMKLVEQVLRGQASSPHAGLEAGTGSGKSLIGLVAALAARVPVIVSTDTKALQNQYRADVRNLQVWLADERPFRAAEVKGRGNYLCLKAWDTVLEQGWSSEEAARSTLVQEHIAELEDWADETETGDLEDFDGDIPFVVKRELVADRSTCVGKACTFYTDCWANKALNKAARADVVIVNHALLMTDIQVRAETGGQASVIPLGRKPRTRRDPDDVDDVDSDAPDTPISVLPAVLIDEAHNLEERARSAFGVEVTPTRFRWLVDRIESHTIHHKRIKQIASMDKRGQLPLDETGEDMQRRLASARQWETMASTLLAASYRPFDEWQTRCNEAGKSALRLGDETIIAARCLELLSQISAALAGRTPDWLSTDERKTWHKLGETAEALYSDMRRLVTPGDEAQWVRVIEVEESERGTPRLKGRLVAADVAPLLRERLWEAFPHVVAMSATLATGEGLRHWRERVGAPVIEELIVPAPFDYERKALLYLPANAEALDPRQLNAKGATEDTKRAYWEALTAEMLAVATAAQPAGGTFLLFTSKTAMNQVYVRFKAAAPQGWTIMKQGDAALPILIQRFEADGHAILFGLKSCWEGVNVPGAALSAVVINAFPFPPPDDPIWAAQCQLVDRAEGRRMAWFGKLAVPSATVALKQAFGRLIRSMNCRGVVAILDGRCSNTSYGPSIVAALPPARKVRDLAAVQAFFAKSA